MDRNSRAAYEAGRDKLLSFEYQHCRDQGLTFAVAIRIEFCACGMESIVRHLIDQNPKVPGDVDRYVKSIRCWADGTSEEIMNALFEYLGSP